MLQKTYTYEGTIDQFVASVNSSKFFSIKDQLWIKENWRLKFSIQSNSYLATRPVGKVMIIGEAINRGTSTEVNYKIVPRRAVLFVCIFAALLLFTYFFGVIDKGYWLGLLLIPIVLVLGFFKDVHYSNSLFVEILNLK